MNLHEEVRSRGVHVHVGGRNRAILLAGGEQLVNVFGRTHGLQREARNKVPFLALPDLELRPLIVWADEEVPDLLIVDFDECPSEFHLPARPFPGHFEELVEGAHVEARVVSGALHGVRLPRAGLAVGKDAHVVAVDHGDDEVADAGKDHGLGGVLFENLVELPRLLRSRRILSYLYFIARREGNAAARLVSCQRPHPAIDTDVPLHFLHEVVQFAPPGTLDFVLVLPLLCSRFNHLGQIGRLAPDDLLKQSWHLSVQVCPD
mmetsp:Transcript_35653/g.82844  ORF Transcript_35653/g.82844 Transcript_35653/m.82844 type:complete len:262 (+) Transcript_35653:588-1373(+)